MRKGQIIEIIERRIKKQSDIMWTYERGSAHDRAAAARHELIDLLIEVEKIGTKKEEATP